MCGTSLVPTVSTCAPAKPETQNAKQQSAREHKTRRRQKSSWVFLGPNRTAAKLGMVHLHRYRNHPAIGRQVQMNFEVSRFFGDDFRAMKPDSFMYLVCRVRRFWSGSRSRSRRGRCRHRRDLDKLRLRRLLHFDGRRHGRGMRHIHRDACRLQLRLVIFP